MSANRSVQAAQKRRAGPPDGGMPGKGPQPSINSAQMFANQVRPGPGPNIPNGRLAGQQASIQQKQSQQQHKQQTVEGVAGVSKMTIVQAITLITLRLGSVETKLMKLENETPSQSMTFDCQENMTLLDKNAFQSISSRLESLEKRSVTGTGTDIILLKQQVETVKQSLIQTKGTIAVIVKDNKDLKTQVDSLKNELTETRELLTSLQNLTMDHSQKIMEFSLSNFGDVQTMDGEMGNFTENPLENLTDKTLENLTDDKESNKIINANLKESVTSEFNNLPII